jgi:hypothetical protein
MLKPLLGVLHRTSWSSGSYSGDLEIKPAILKDVFRGFTQYLEAIDAVVP